MKPKKFGVILISCLIVIPLLFGGTAYAQTDAELPSSGINPDSPFYFMDIWGEKAGLFFAFGAEAKAKKGLEYAQERLAEAHAMAIKNKSKEVRRATNGYDEYVAIAIEKVEEARNKGADISEVSAIVALAMSKHLSILDAVADIVPEEAKEAIAQARGVSINGQENALRILTGENPERAMEINLAAVNGRLNRVKEKVEKNEMEEAENAVQEFERLNKFGEEISEIAQGLGKDTTTVEQLVAKATSAHLEVLAGVYEKVPEQARLAIEQAMRVSVTGRERAVEALKKKDALGGIPEEPSVPEWLPGEVKNRLKLELADAMLARVELQKQATEFNFKGGTHNGTEIAPALKGDEEVEIDGVVKTAAEWYDEAMDYLDEAHAAYEAGDYAEAKEITELAKDIFDALNNFTGQTTGFWNLEGKPEESSPPTDKGEPEETGPPAGKGTH